MTIAPAQTLTDRLYQELRGPGQPRVIRAVGRDGRPIQFAVNPATGEIVVIEMNPRVSRCSSALASKATGFLSRRSQRSSPRLCARGDRQRHHRDQPASFEPTIDYVVTKVPRFASEKFPGSRGALGLHEVGRRGDGDRPHLPRVVREGDALARARRGAGPHRRDWRAKALGSSIAVARSIRRAARGLRRGVEIDDAQDAALDRSVVPARAARPGGRRRRHRRAGAHVPACRHMRGRVRGPDAVLLLTTSGRPRFRAKWRGDRDWSSSSARDRTGSARGSSSTTAACTPR